MRSPTFGRRRALALGAAAVGGSGCLGLLDDGSEDAVTGEWNWPSVGGSTGNGWRVTADEPPTEWPAVVDTWTVGGEPTAVARGDTAAFAGESLLVLDETFEERWQERPPSDDYEWGRCAIGPALLYAWSLDGTLHAFDPATGALEWTFDEPVHENAVESMHPDYRESNPEYSRRVLATLHPTDDACIVVTASARVGWPDPDARVVALDPDTGDELWIEPTEGASGAAVTDEHLVVATTDRLLGLEHGTGDVAWTQELGQIERRLPTLADGTVFVYAGQRAGLVAIEASSGDELWTSPVPPGSNPVRIGDRLYVLGAGILFSVDVADGAAQRVALAPRADRLFAADDTLYARSGSTLTALTTDGETEGELSTPGSAAEPVVLDDRLLVPLSDGTVRAVATQPTVDRLFGREGAPDGDRIVVAAPAGEPRFEPSELQIEVGTTVQFAWGAPTTPFEVRAQPDEADWSPAAGARETDDQLEHTFSEPGQYEFSVRRDGRTARGEIFVTDDGLRDTVVVGPDGDFQFEPESVRVPPGTTVTWEWDSSTHNVDPTEQPERADWDGHPDLADEPNTYEHTFDVPGTYEYQCEPHASAGMVGEVVVEDDSTAGFDGTVVVGPDGEFAFEPEIVVIHPGTTVRFEWDSPIHNVSPQYQPSDAAWEGHPEIVDDPNDYEHTFDVPGTYEYQCDPHAAAGMVGTIVVREE